MIRRHAASMSVVWSVGIGLLLSAGIPAAAGPGDHPIFPGKPVQSNNATAASGRKPLAVRIAMADKLKPQEPPAAFKKSASTTTTQPDTAAAPADVPSAAVSAAISSTVAPAAVDGTGVDRPNVPRLLVDCEESTVDARHGESIRWRITIRNAGATAHHVLTTLYFAEGIEPAAATGHDHSLAAGEVRFSPVETVGEDDSIQLEVIGRAVRPGAVAYRVEVGCRDLPGHVAREAVVLVRPKAGD